MGSSDITRSEKTSQLVSRVAFLVPEHGGYRSKESRRDDDGRLRVEVCERIDRATARLEDFLLDISEDGWTAGVEGIDRMIRRLDGLRESVATTSTEYTAFFSRDDFDAGEMESLLDADLTLLVELDDLGERLDDLGTPHFTSGLRRETEAELDGHLDRIEQSIERRAAAAREAGDGRNA